MAASSGEPRRGAAAGGKPHRPEPALVRSAPVVLVGIQVFFAVVVGLFALFPPLAQTPRGVFAVGAALCLLLAVFTALVVPRLPDIWLAMSAGATGLVFALVTLGVTTPQGQVGAGLALVLPAVFAAQHTTRWQLGALLAVVLGAWVVALVINPRLPGAVVWVLGIVGIVSYVAYLVFDLESRLRFEAEHDALTGALNRHGLDTRGDMVRGMMNRSGRPVAVVLVDLDDFKRFNDVHGHRAGDDLLRGLVAGWRPQLRADDLLVRYGGDEFALVLPGATTDDAEALLVRLRSGDGVAWTCGVSWWSPDETVYEALVRADVSLYRAKEARGGG